MGSLEGAFNRSYYGFIVDPLGVMLSDFGSMRRYWGAMNWNNKQFESNYKRWRYV